MPGRLSPHWGRLKRSDLAESSSSVDVVSVSQDQSQSVRSRVALTASTAAMRESGKQDVPFGAESPADEAAFLTAIDGLLEELGVQFAARGFRSGAALSDVRKEVLTLRARLEGAASNCSCEHSPRHHRTNGCNWENTLGTEHCGCTELISGLAPVQIRTYVQSTPDSAF